MTRETSRLTSRRSAEAGRRSAGSLCGALAAAAAAAALCGCTMGKSKEQHAAPKLESHGVAQPVNAPVQDDGQWTMPAKDYAATRYSGLNEINTGDVQNLKVAFTFSTGIPKGQEAAPLVVGDTMYVVTPWPNYLYALDLSKPGAPMKWKFDPSGVRAAQGVACCDVVNRGAVYSNGRIYYNTLDGRTFAVDAKTGAKVWSTQVGDINKGETVTMAPLVVKGKVLVGDSGGEFGVRGWIQALDAATGKPAWKAYNTGPDADVLIGADFHPYYPQYRGKDLGLKTWPAGAWKLGGGTVWGWIAYDPQLNLIYYGAGNPGPWNAEQRPGDNLWTSGVFARDPDTGAAKWFYQMTPHDVHDYDGINEQILLDLPIGGQTRHVMVRPERNGYLYVIDRATGQVLSADPFAYINSTKGVDLASGRLLYNEEKIPKQGVTIRDICPVASGAKDWEPSAWSPRTRLLYIPHANLCMDWMDEKANYIAGTPYVGAEVKFKPGPSGYRGAFTAWDPVKRGILWEIKEDLPVWSGTVATAGDLVFYGTMDGWFKAVDARSGRLLWRFKTGSGIIGQPVVYRGPDGHEYVAVLDGVGGWSGAVVSNDLDPRDPTGALGFVGAMADLKQKTSPGGTLYVFALPH